MARCGGRLLPQRLRQFIVSLAADCPKEAREVLNFSSIEGDLPKQPISPE
jgi:hypothetical protein